MKKILILILLPISCFAQFYEETCITDMRESEYPTFWKNGLGISTFGEPYEMFTYDYVVSYESIVKKRIRLMGSGNIKLMDLYLDEHKTNKNHPGFRLSGLTSYQLIRFKKYGEKKRQKSNLSKLYFIPDKHLYIAPRFSALWISQPIWFYEDDRSQWTRTNIFGTYIGIAYSSRQSFYYLSFEKDRLKKIYDFINIYYDYGFFHISNNLEKWGNPTTGWKIGFEFNRVNYGSFSMGFGFEINQIKMDNPDYDPIFVKISLYSTIMSNDIIK